MGSGTRVEKYAIQYGPILACPRGHEYAGMGKLDRACPYCELEWANNVMLRYARAADATRRLDMARKEG